ncbi:MAG: hypothetical protein V4563_18170 [Pseudomonadota bacterium]
MLSAVFVILMLAACAAAALVATFTAQWGAAIFWWAVLIAALFYKLKHKPECPRWAMGYKCQAGDPRYPNGCSDCGRGAK